MLTNVLLSPQRLRDWFFKCDPIPDALAMRGNLPTLLFLLGIVFYCLYLLLLQPGWVLSGEMWAEMATNYYPISNSSSLVVKLFSTDSGYIPLLQRLLAALGQSFGPPASSIPYFYTWSAIILTGVMVASFCLKPFRVLVKNDLLRFFTALAVLLVADFETRTFINFTYFGAFFVAIISAQALVEKSNQVSWWAWFIPVIMVSKPALLSVLPAMVLAALVSKSRFRKITLLVLLLCLVQVVTMIMSHSSGMVVSTSNFTIFEKLHSTIKYFLGFLGFFFAGKAVSVEFSILRGLGIILFCIIVLCIKRNNASALILVGLILLFSNVLINSFTLSDYWNLNMARLMAGQLYRHNIVCFFGVVLIVVGSICTFLSDNNERIKFLKAVPPFLFLIWFYFSGWYTIMGLMNRSPNSPIIDNSQWQKMAYIIDSGGPVCVPINPFGWIFGRNCFQLNPDISWGKPYSYKNFSTNEQLNSVAIVPPPIILNKNLMSLAVLAKPRMQTPRDIDGKAIIEMKDGSTKHMYGNRKLPASGGLLMFTTNYTIPTSDIRSIILKFSVPVDIGYITNEPNDNPAVLWLGN
ncbi:Uncharacterised protein [Legionella sainthelensi]|uniref:hypothetical protein n=1 Tax=Legionella sainthelensi TaxID=28087 RepID=UPI000F6F1649|nr:hypothetical protein [Legionella sainthelensi]VEB38803.1 Uncharacterised protein [Legionella sainthelensi]